ncbi:MAG: DUF3017 domain-containing protein [Actinobacteria bacterium]|nr:DUF3017 domain-containing protein [Actinomycetota bacterium]
MTGNRSPLTERRGLLGMVRRQWAWFVTVAIFAVGAAYAMMPTGHWRRGSAIMGLALLVGAVLRGWLGDKAGLLVVRARWLDTAAMLLMGVGIMVLAFWVPAATKVPVP